MNEKKLNNNHPDCEAYTKRFKEIWDYYDKMEEMEKSKYTDWNGLDHPAEAVLHPIYKKCCEDTKRLQEEYSYLFTEEE